MNGKRKKIIRVTTVPMSLDLLLKGQLRMLAEHYEVVALSSPGPEMERVREREGVRTLTVPMERRIAPLKDLVSLIRLIHVFWKERPDMVHSLTPKAGLLSMMAGWVTRVPVRMHTFTGLVFPTATGKLQKLLMAMDRLMCFCATHINPEGEGVKRNLEEYHITSKPLHIIAHGNVNGIDLTHYDRTPEVMAQADSYRQKDTFTFCFVGRMVRDKGINELVSAFLRLHAEHPKVRLVLVGTFEQQLDPVSTETEDAIRHHPAIDFMDYQPDVRPFLAAADALVFPSYREGFPNVVIQAGALGLPAIVTDINGCNEIILPGQNGVIIPSHDEEALLQAMKHWVTHPDEVKAMAAQARPLVASRYDQPLMWEGLLNEYRTLLNNQ